MAAQPPTVRRPETLSALPVAYGPLFDRAMAVLGGDERVRAIWLAGALGRGAADAASDLDFAIAVRDEHFEAFASGWREWLAAISPTLVARELHLLLYQLLVESNQPLPPMGPKQWLTTSSIVTSRAPIGSASGSTRAWTV